MANTTNFNWETPDDTDLVKDGAAAIRTLGSAIDTSLVDLKGGTTGQVLSKATNTDMDFTWVAQDDSNAIQNAIIDAKGDLIVGTAADTPARLAVGTNGYVLTADSAETAGIKWAAAASGTTFSGCRLTKSVGQTISNNTDTMITWDVESFDVGSYHSNTTNNTRITIPSGKAGYYQINATLSFAANATGQRVITLAKNGTNRAYNLNIIRAVNAGGYTSVFYSDVVYGAVADYFEISTFQDSGGNVNVIGDNGDAGASYVSFALIGA